MSNLVIWICGVILALAALGALYRIWRGPTLLDRVLGTDVLLSIIVAVICVNMVVTGEFYLTTLLAVISLVGFVGAVTVARYANNAPSQEKRLKPSRIQEVNPNDPTAKQRLEQEKKRKRARRRRKGDSDGEQNAPQSRQDTAVKE